MTAKRVVIMGAAGRDFHNFNSFFRDRDDVEVVAFTATQIPDIEGRAYPSALAGKNYPDGVPIYDEADLPRIIREYDVDEVVFAYSDVSHKYVMNRASLVNSCGADFRLMGPKTTMLKSKVPLITVCATRTGSGKSQTTRLVSRLLKEELDKNVVVIRHPMPYGDLEAQKVQRYEDYSDLDRYDCTIEEREEYEPHIDEGLIVYAGVDYETILKKAEEEADVILWDGGNNDLPFYESDLHMVVVDPHRAGHELEYYPGETNLRMADVVIINKQDTASLEDIESVRNSTAEVNPGAEIVDAASPLFVENPDLIRGSRVLVIEDGPTLTHGDMEYGAGIIAARKYGATEIIDPREKAVGSIRETYESYPHIGSLLPAMGYGEKQVRELKETIDAVDCDLIVVGTPIDISRVIEIDKPTVRVRYELQEIGQPRLKELLASVL